MRYLFEAFCLDTDRRELTHSGEVTHVEPQVFDLLEYLVRNHERLVTRDDLIASVWNARIVSESTLATRINAARSAIGDSGDQQRLIKTIPRKGLRFVGAVRKDAMPGLATAEAAPVEAPIPDKPSIAVLPFANLIGDPGQDYFVDGIVEGITLGLCRKRWLFVVARNSSFTYKGRAVDVKQIGRELGVRYVLEGSVQKAGSRVRVGVQLVDAKTGARISADRFDGTLDDIFALQDDVSAAAIGMLVPRLERAETARVANKPTEKMDAYDLYLRGCDARRKNTPEGFTEALRLFQEATRIDPDYAVAHAMASYTYMRRATQGWVSDGPPDVAEALRLARHAITLGAEDADALCHAGYAIAHLGGDLEAGGDAIERALALNPNLSVGWALGGWIEVWRGESAVAIERFQRAMRLSPLDPMLYVMESGTAAAHFVAGRYEASLSWAARALRKEPRDAPSHRITAAALGMAGRIGEARTAMAHAIASDPGLRLGSLSIRAPWRPAPLASLIEGLRLAGLPD